MNDSVTPASGAEGTPPSEPNGSGGDNFNPNDPRIQQLFDTKVKGLVENKEQILREKKELESQFKAMKDQLGDIDPAVVKNLVTRMQNDEETKLIAEGKIDEVINRRHEAFKRDYDSKLTAKDKLVQEYDSKVKSLQSKIEDLTIGSMVRDVAGEMGIVPSAVDDVVHRVRKAFQLDEEFKPIARDENGTLIVGKDAKSPMSIKEYLENMREKTPHWYAGSSGAGSQTGGRGPSGRPTITKEEAQDHATYKARLAEAQKLGFDRPLVVG